MIKRGETDQPVLIEEILDLHEYNLEDICIGVAVIEIEPQQTSEILAYLTDHIPLQTFRLCHLKRARRNTAIVGFKMEVVICPEGSFHEFVEKLTIKTLPTTYSIRQVPRIPPERRSEFESWGKLWPLNFHPHEADRERERGFQSIELDAIGRFFSLVDEDSVHLSTAQESTKQTGAVLVNPINQKVASYF